LIIHPDFLDAARLAAREAGISEDRIVFIEKSTHRIPGHTSLEDLIELGTRKAKNFSERQFKAGEAKNNLAFLSFSSGTTGIILHIVKPTCPFDLTSQGSQKFARIRTSNASN